MGVIQFQLCCDELHLCCAISRGLGHFNPPYLQKKSLHLLAEVGFELRPLDSEESMLPLCHGTVDGDRTFVGKYICNVYSNIPYPL